MSDMRKVAERVLELDGKATDGPWHELYLHGVTGNLEIQLRDGGVQFKKEDQDFTLFARTAAPELAKAYLKAVEALEKIYMYRSDEPDWNMVMAIAGDIVDPREMVEQ